MTKTNAGPWALLCTRRFLPLFLVQALGAFNDNVFKNAMVALLTFRLAAELNLELTTHLTMASGLFILPFALLAPAAGQLADGMDKARLMRWVKFAEIVIMVGGAIAFYLRSIEALYVLLFLMGAQSAFFSPIKYGILPQYLPGQELVAGNAMIAAATFLTILLGQILGAKLILADQGILLISVAVIGIAVVGWIASLYAPSAPPMGPAPKVDWTFVRAVWQVCAEARQFRAPWRAIWGTGWFWFVGAIYLALLPAFSRNELGGNEDVYILLLAAFSVGVAIGAFLTNRLLRGEARVGVAPMGSMGIGVFSMLLLVAAQGYQAALGAPAPESVGVSAFLSHPMGWAVLLCLVGVASCAGLFLTPLNVVMQATAPPAARGRVVAASNVVDAALMVASSFVGGFLAAMGLSTAGVYAAVGLACVPVGLLVARWAPETRLGAAILRLWPEKV